ncbi:MAG: tetratricopeptide repeat protein [Acidobacteria bacterium]|nr:tetratricopeptide repeat protein [Acidobacteriota bacterium]
MEKKLKELYEFADFRLDVEERLLLRADEVVPLPPKAFDVLLALVEQPGHLLEKEVLLKTVWPDTFVEENNLADNISRLRKTLGEGADGRKFIETVPRRGYRFVAEVKSLNEADAAASPVTVALQPEPDTERLRLRQRPETLFVAFGLVGLIFLSAALYWRFKPVPRAEVVQLEFKGNFFVGRWTEDEIRQGIEYYNQAIALAPNSASAYEGLANGWSFLSDLHVSPREAMPKAQAAVMNALQRDEKSAPAHVSLGVIKMQYDWDGAGAEQEFKRALALYPEYAAGHQLYGWYLIAMGRLDEAQAEMKQALGTDPLNDFGLWGVGDSFYFARQYDQAIEQYRRAVSVAPKMYWSRLMLGCAYVQQGKFSEALVELQQARRLNDSPQPLAALGHAYAAAGQHAEAQAVLAELQTLAQRKYVSPYDVATIYAALGEKEPALDWLEKAYADRCGWLAWWLKVDPKFDSLRADERFAALLRRIGLAH